MKYTHGLFYIIHRGSLTVTPIPGQHKYNVSGEEWVNRKQ